MALFMGPLYFCKLVFISTVASALYSLLETSTPPFRVSMKSQGLEYILSWEPGNNTGTPTYYRVMYTNRSPFKTVKECSNITHLFCNLTKELTDFDHLYTIKVERFTENGRQMSALQFNPYSNTCLPPALFDISACPGCINVTVKLSSSLLEKYKEFKYTIKVVKAGFTETPIRNATRKENFHTVVGGLSPNTNYCISVDVSTTLTNQCTPSALKCIVTSSEAKPGLVVYSVLGGVFMMMAVVFLVFFLLKTGYICLKEKHPKVLNIFPNILFDKLLVQLDPKAHSIQIIQKSKRRGAEHNYEDDYESNGENDGGYTPRGLLYKISKSCSKEDCAELLSIDSSSVASDCQLPELLDSEAESLQCHTNEEENTTDQIFCSTSEPTLTSLPEPEINGCLNINLNTVMVGIQKWDAGATLSPYEEDAADFQELCVSNVPKPKHFTERKDMQHTGVHKVAYAQQNPAGSGESESSDSETDCIGEYMRR